MKDEAFTPDEFDPWAESYDHDVASQDQFPFNGYEQVLDAVAKLAQPSPGMTVLDIGTGTGNLARRLSSHGCELWCTDFSEAMLAKARLKLPQAHFVLHDLRAAWPEELDRRFDRVVSAYVFHHFDLANKVGFCSELVSRRLEAGGRLVIADLSFPDQKTMEEFAASVGDLWEQEPYWLADQAMSALRAAGLRPKYEQVSACAGVYTFSQ
jgi:putative AdoMet-dependent methyltransferase